MPMSRCAPTLQAAQPILSQVSSTPWPFSAAEEFLPLETLPPTQNPFLSNHVTRWVCRGTGLFRVEAGASFSKAGEDTNLPM